MLLLSEIPAIQSILSDHFSLLFAAIGSVASFLAFWFSPLKLKWKLCGDELPGNVSMYAAGLVVLGSLLPLLLVTPASAVGWLGVALVLAVFGAWGYLRHDAMLAEHRYEVCRSPKRNKIRTCFIIGGDELTEQAQRELSRAKAEGRSLTIQDLLAGYAYNPDAVWKRESRVRVRTQFLRALLVTVFLSTVALLIGATVALRSPMVRQPGGVLAPTADWQVMEKQGDGFFARRRFTDAVTRYGEALEESKADLTAHDRQRLLGKLGVAQVEAADHSRNFERSVELYDAATPTLEQATKGGWLDKERLGIIHSYLARAFLARLERATGEERRRLLASALKAGTTAAELVAHSSSSIRASAAVIVAGAHIAIAEDRVDAERRTHLENALRLCEGALVLRSRETDPNEWGWIKANQGRAHQILADGLAPAQAAREYEMAASCYSDYLDQTREDGPTARRLRAMGNLADALRERAKFADAAEFERYHERAVATLRAGIEGGGKDSSPYDWGHLNNALGLWCVDRAERQPVEARALLYREAEASYQRSLGVYSLAAHPRDWATVQSNMGDLYRVWAATGPEQDSRILLGKAAAAFERSLQYFTLKDTPQPWRTVIQNAANVAADRASISDASDKATFLDESVRLLRAALAAAEGAGDIADRAMIQGNLAEVLSRFATVPAISAGALEAKLTEAERLLERTLAVRSRGAAPFDWAITKKRSGDIHSYAAQVLPGDDSVKQERARKAIAAYEEALEVLTEKDYAVWHRELRAVIAGLKDHFKKP